MTTTGIALTGTGNINLGATALAIPSGFSSTLALANGTLGFSTAGTYNVNFNSSFGTTTADFTTAGTYDLRGATITGTIHLSSSNNSTVTVKLLPGVTYVNDTPAHITVDNAFNVTLTVANIIAGSRIQVYDTDSSTELYNEIVAGTTFTKTWVYASDINVRIRLKYSAYPVDYYWYTATTAITSSGFSINAAQVENTVYENANVDGSTVTSCSVSGTTIRIYIDDPTNAIAAQVIYNWYQYYLFSEAGIREQDGAYITATDDTHYIFDNTMKIINSDTANPLNITGANITPVSGAATNIFDLTNGASIALNFNRVEGFSYSSGSGLSTAEHNQVMAIPLTTPKIATDGDTNLAIINT
jgi:hypothetical protein